jgi:hypothetical protein
MVIVVASISSIYINADKKINYYSFKENVGKEFTPEEFKEWENELIKHPMTEEQKKQFNEEKEAHAKEVRKMIDSAHKDIISSYNFNQNEYTIYHTSEYDNMMNSIKDDKLKQKIGYFIYKGLKDMPNGAIEPIFLMKNDSTEIVFVYKDADGNNICVKQNLNSEKLDKQEVKGKPVEKSW